MEMRKLLKESEAKVEKSALGLGFYAEHTEIFIYTSWIERNKTSGYGRVLSHEGLKNLLIPKLFKLDSR